MEGIERRLQRLESLNIQTRQLNDSITTELKELRTCVETEIIRMKEYYETQLSDAREENEQLKQQISALQKQGSNTESTQKDVSIPQKGEDERDKASVSTQKDSLVIPESLPIEVNADTVIRTEAPPSKKKGKRSSQRRRQGKVITQQKMIQLERGQKKTMKN